MKRKVSAKTNMGIKDMKIRILFASVVSLLILLGACQSQPEYCTVKGTIKGVDEGEKLQLTDAYDHFKVIESESKMVLSSFIPTYRLLPMRICTQRKVIS